MSLSRFEYPHSLSYHATTLTWSPRTIVSSESAIAEAVVIVLVVNFLSLGWRLLPQGRRGAVSMDAALNIENYTTEAVLLPGSPMAGRTVAELEALGEGGVAVATVIRERFRRYTPHPGWELRPDDVLLLQGEPEDLDRVVARAGLRLAGEQDIPVRRDLFRYYHSDAQSAVEAGHDIRTALLAFGCDATHGYERTHIDSLKALSRLLTAYMMSPPVFASDAQPAQGSLERFSHQLEHDAQMENDTRVPPVDTLIGRHSNPQERNS